MPEGQGTAWEARPVVRVQAVTAVLGSSAPLA
jgi:hypothetical protein